MINNLKTCNVMINNSVIQAVGIAALLALPMSTLATVGGGQRIEVVGYEPTDQKVYILRHFDDGRGRLPQLYYYDLKAKYPQPLVEVRSLYINPKTKKYDELDYQNTFFTNRLNSIKQRVITLKSDYVPTTIKVNSFTQRQAKVESWLEDLGVLTEYKFDYKVVTDDGKYTSLLQSVTGYRIYLVADNNLYRIPNQPYAVTTVKYIGTLMEGGYEYEDVVLLKQGK